MNEFVKVFKMKRLLIILAMVLGLLTICKAQENNESKSIVQKVDSLQFQLNKLQRDYAYLYCKYELNQLINELLVYSNSVNVKSNALLIKCHHDKYRPAIYRASRELYDVFVELLESNEEYMYSIKMRVSTKMYESNLSEEDVKMLKKILNSLDSGFSAAKDALERYKVIIDEYRNLN